MSIWPADPPDFYNNSTHRAFAMLLGARVAILEQLVKQFLPIQTSRMLDAHGSLLEFCLPVWWNRLKTSLSVFRALQNANIDIR